jgi:hypothetical protein
MATDDRVIRALLRFGIDNKTLAQVKKGAKSVEDALGDLGDNAEQAAKDIQKAFETVAKSGKYSVKELDRATLELNAALKTLGKTGRYSINEIGAAAKSTKSILSDVIGVAGLYTAGDAAKQFVVGSYQMAAEAERLGTATDNLGKRFGVSGQQIVDSIQRASRGTISEIEAMQAANAAMILGVVRSEEEFAKLTEIAVTLGRAFGKDANESMAALTEGLGRGSPEILNNIGIVIKAEEAYQSWAETNDRTVESMSSTEKQAAITAAAIKFGEGAVAELGGVTDDTAAKTERLAAGWADFQTAFGKLLGDAGAIDLLNTMAQNLIDGAEAWSFVFKEAKKLRLANQQSNHDDPNADRVRLGRKASIYGAMPFLAIPGEVTGATDSILDLVEGMGKAAVGSKEMAEAYQELSTAEETAAAAAAAVGDETGETGNTLDKATVSADDYAAALERVNDANEKLETDYRRKQIEAERDSLRDLAEMEEKFQQTRLDMAVDHQRELLDIAQELANERVDIARKAAQEIADIERKYAQAYADAGTDYKRDVAQVDQDLANERLSTERDYQQRLADIRRQFDLDAQEAVFNNDAIAFLQAQRKRDDDLTEAQIDRDRQLEESRITADQKREQLRQARENELDDLRQALERELEEQRRATKRQLEEAQLANERAIAEAQEKYQQELADQTNAENRKRAALQTAYNQKLNDLKRYHNQRIVDTRNAMQKELEIVQQYAARMRTTSSNRRGISGGGGGANYSGYTRAMSDKYKAAFRGSRAAGGYASQRGMYEMAEGGREFVLNAATTKAMEQGIGGALSQAAILGLTRRGVGRSLNYAPQYTFTERDDARLIMSQIEQQLDSKLLKMERGY